jgi:hypothetical protein
MKKTLGSTLIFILLLISEHAYSQVSLKEHLLGQWTVKGNYDLGATIPPDTKQEIEMMQAMFSKSKFNFQENHVFSLDFPRAEMTLKNGYWEILADNHDIIIKEWKDKDNANGPIFMGLKILIKDGKTIFIMEETFFAFEMQKL